MHTRTWIKLHRLLAGYAVARKPLPRTAEPVPIKEEVVSCVSPSVFASENRKARKEHACCECKGKILKGEVYNHFSGIWEGRAGRYRTCVECDRIRRAAIAESNCASDEGPAFQGLQEFLCDLDLDLLAAEFEMNQARRNAKPETKER